MTQTMFHSERQMLKGVGRFIKLVWNVLLAGRTVVVGGTPVVLPKLDKKQAYNITSTKVHLSSILGK